MIKADGVVHRHPELASVVPVGIGAWLRCNDRWDIALLSLSVYEMSPLSFFHDVFLAALQHLPSWFLPFAVTPFL